MSNQFKITHTSGESIIIDAIFADFLKAEEKLAKKGKTAETHKLAFNTTALYYACKRSGATSDPFTVWVASVESYEAVENEEDEEENTSFL